MLSGTSLDPNEIRYVFKMAKRIRSAGEASTNGAGSFSDDYIGSGDHHVMAFDVHDVADFYIPNVVFDGSQTKAQNGMAFDPEVYSAVAYILDRSINGIPNRHRHLWWLGHP